MSAFCDNNKRLICKGSNGEASNETDLVQSTSLGALQDVLLLGKFEDINHRMVES